MKTETNEFSFVLKPAKYGVGVFAKHDIAKGTILRLFGDSKKSDEGYRVLPKESVDPDFLNYCLLFEDKVFAPLDFGRMEIGWYLNHSKDSNAEHVNYEWFAKRDIKKDEEILIDYNTLGEPESMKSEYYKY